MAHRLKQKMIDGYHLAGWIWSSDGAMVEGWIGCQISDGILMVEDHTNNYGTDIAAIARALSRRGPMDAADFRTFLRQELNKAFGERVVGLYLIGSRARGDQRLDSDWDVVVLLSSDYDRWADVGCAGDVRAYMIEEAGEMVDVLPMPVDQLGHSPIGEAVRREGVVL